jgi:hypothetical protein
MNDSKLVNLLRTFSKNEIKEFEKLISSPFFNKGRNYVPLLKQLKKFHPKFDDEKMTQEYIYSKINPGKEFNKQVMWNMSSALLDMAEDFLLQVSLRKDKFLRGRQIAEELHNRNLPEYFAKKLDEIGTGLEQKGLSPEYFHYKMNLEYGWKEYYYKEEKTRDNAINEDKEGEFSIQYCLWSIMRVVNDMSVNKATYNTFYEIDITHEFLRNLQLEKLIYYCREKKYKFTWLLDMYYNQYMMILEPGKDKYFIRLRDLFEKNYSKFTEQAKMNWFATLMNYCIYKSDMKSRKLLFELHKFELKEGLGFIRGYIPKTHYLQVLKNAIAIKETDWIKKFIDEFTPKLKPSYQKQMRAIALAYLCLELKNYDGVYENLGKIRFSDLKDKLTVKIIYLRAYYESNETEALLSHVDTTYHFIDNNSEHIPEDIAENYRIFLRQARKLTILKEKNDFFELEKIKKTLVENPNQFFRDWLLEKIVEIKKGAV